MSVARFKPQAEPATPPAGYIYFFCDIADDLLYLKFDTGTVVPVKPVGGGTGDLLSDGSVPLTANWDIGSFDITAEQFHSDIATGTSPFTVASTTVVTNLNSDKLDGADLIDEDNMASNSDVHVPTQQSVKAYVDSMVAGGVEYKGGYNAATNTPDLDTAPSGVIKGDMYTVTAAGSFFTATVEIGDVIIAEIDTAAVETDWTIIQANIVYTAAQIKTLYESNADTNALTDARAAAVDAALVDGDFVAGEGVMRKTGAGTYAAIKTNLSATVAPVVTDDSAAGYGIYSPWIDTVADKLYFCLDASVGAAVWQEVGAGGGASDPDAIHDNVSGEIAALTEKATPVSADLVIIEDSADANAKKKVQVGNLPGGAGTTQTAEMIAGFIGTPSDKDYRIVVKMAHGGTVTETTTISVSGTCTATFKVNSTALGGTANSVSSTEQSQAHGSTNTFVAGDDIVITVSANSSCVDMSFSIKYTRTLE